MKVALTFDLDFIDHETGEYFSDDLKILSTVLDLIKVEFPEVRTTVFIRLDRRVEIEKKEADFYFSANANLINKLQMEGHELGWHFHAYDRLADKWVVNSNLKGIVEDVYRFGEMARKWNLKISRMGWGYHTNETYKAISDLGFECDSSSITRPKYHWDNTQSDWTGAPTTPYFPSLDDYRRTGEPSHPCIQIPISTAVIKAPYDTQEVVRYLNFAFYSHLLEEPLKNFCRQRKNIVTVTHPYELAATGIDNGLISHKNEEYLRNIISLKHHADNLEFVTISELKNTNNE